MKDDWRNDIMILGAICTILGILGLLVSFGKSSFGHNRSNLKFSGVRSRFFYWPVEKSNLSDICCFDWGSLCRLC